MQVASLRTNPGGLTKEGVENTVAMDLLLGHAVLFDWLFAKKKLSKAAPFTGSEVARGEPGMVPTLKLNNSGSVENCVSIIDGGFHGKKAKDTMTSYCGSKFLGAFWMSGMSLQYPGMRLLTVSPGQTAGTAMKWIPKKACHGRIGILSRTWFFPLPVACGTGSQP
jgi:hypothetical protein